MTHDPSIPSDAARLSGLPASSAQPKRTDGTGGAAFKALLQKLDDRARDLGADGDSLERPEQLASAVDRARASIDEAQSLSDQILEAYRAERQRADADEGGEQG